MSGKFIRLDRYRIRLMPVVKYYDTRICIFMNIVDFPEWMEKTTQLEINTTIILKLYAS